MAATIKCRQTKKQEIKEILLKELGGLMNNIREDEASVSVQKRKMVLLLNIQ